MSNTVEKAIEIVRSHSANGTYSNQYCVLCQEEMDGSLTASVITAANSDGLKSLTFCTGYGESGGKVGRILRDPRACVCFDSASYGITLVGKMEVLRDADSKKANWYAGLENHFSGPDDPEMCVLKFTTERCKLFIIGCDYEDLVF